MTPAIKKMLLDPAAANLQNPVIPTVGFTVDSIGPATNGGNNTDGHNLITALATHDVLVCLNNTGFSYMFSTADRTAFLTWAAAKGHGVVGFHGVTDDNGDWPEKITFFGGKFTTHATGNATVIGDTTASNSTDPNFQAINAGIPKTLSVTDEWYSYQSAPRAIPGIHVLSTLNEATYPVTSKMGDHPISWYRVSDTGGRMYYTGAGHLPDYFISTYWLRRQIYNGILWASGWSASSKVHETLHDPRTAANRTEVSGTALTVSIFREGPHSVEIRSLDGKRVSMMRGQGAQTHTFSGLKSGSVYAVLTVTRNEKTRQLVTTR